MNVIFVSPFNSCRVPYMSVFPPVSRRASGLCARPGPPQGQIPAPAAPFPPADPLASVRCGTNLRSSSAKPARPARAPRRRCAASRAGLGAAPQPPDVPLAPPEAPQAVENQRQRPEERRVHGLPRRVQPLPGLLSQEGQREVQVLPPRPVPSGLRPLSLPWSADIASTVSGGKFTATNSLISSPPPGRTPAPPPRDSRLSAPPPPRRIPPESGISSAA